MMFHVCGLRAETTASLLRSQGGVPSGERSSATRKTAEPVAHVSAVRLAGQATPAARRVQERGEAALEDAKIRGA